MMIGLRVARSCCDAYSTSVCTASWRLELAFGVSEVRVGGRALIHSLRRHCVPFVGHPDPPIAEQVPGHGAGRAAPLDLYGHRGPGRVERPAGLLPAGRRAREDEGERAADGVREDELLHADAGRNAQHSSQRLGTTISSANRRPFATVRPEVSVNCYGIPRFERR